MIDTEAYRSFNGFMTNLKMGYTHHISEIDENLQDFELSLYEKYYKTQHKIMNTSYFKYKNIKLDEQDLKRIREIQSSLHYKEMQYTFALDIAYEVLVTEFKLVLDKCKR